MISDGRAVASAHRAVIARRPSSTDITTRLGRAVDQLDRGVVLLRHFVLWRGYPLTPADSRSDGRVTAA